MFKNLDVQALGFSGAPSQVIESALSAGFKAVSLDMVEFAAAAKEQGLPKARRLLDSARLKISGFRLPLDWNSDDKAFAAELERIGELAALAKELSCTRATTTVLPGNDERPFHQNFEFHRQRFGAIGQKLEPLGIRLGVGIDASAEGRANKAFQFITAYDTLQMLLGMVQASNVGVVVDTWDIIASGGSIETMGRFGVEKIVEVRLSDASGSHETGQWPASSRALPTVGGAIDAATVLGTLADLGYDGPVTPLAHGSQMPGRGREAIVKAAGQALDAAWKAAGLTPAGKRGATARS
jgi:sugar phosphate isomerase/epimerase